MDQANADLDFLPPLDVRALPPRPVEIEPLAVEERGLGRYCLYKTLSPDGNPE